MGFPSSPALRFFESVTLHLGIQSRGMMKQTVQDGGGQNLIAEDFSPNDKAFVGGEAQAGFLSASGD